MRLLPDGDGLIVTFLSYLDVPADDPLTLRMALGLETFNWQANAYAERWAHVVEGPHAAQPAAWTYDELRQDEQAIRPFLARDESTGDILVARAWNNLRCKANVTVFTEFTMTDCMLGAVSPIENQWLPLAVTRFSAAGARLGTRILAPDADAGEQVAFALAARDGKLATAGFVARKNADGIERTYPIPAATSTTTATSRSTTATASRSSTTTTTWAAATCSPRSAGCPTTSSRSARRAGTAGRAATASRAAPIR